MPLEATADFLRLAAPDGELHRILVIAGSGLGGFVKSVNAVKSIPYADIPGIGAATVAGHSGTLIWGTIGDSGTPVLVMSGRRHFYEGLEAGETVRLHRAIFAAFPQVEYVLLSNAAGGLNPAFEVGDLMLITDQINWMFANPLIGPNSEKDGPRFPDMCDAYNSQLRTLAMDVARKLQLMLRQGVYVAVHGPSYETRAEISMLRHLMGADAVGMSTVPETIAAVHAGRKVLGISFISNTLPPSVNTTHEEVVENSRLVEEKFGKLLSAMIPEIHALA